MRLPAILLPVMPRADEPIGLMPDPEALPAVVDALAGWQRDGMPVQLHPGDLGWAWQIGAPALAEKLRLWRRGSRTLAVGYLDRPTLIRLAIAPDCGDDGELADAMLADIAEPSRGVLPDGSRSVEARFGTALRSRLESSGWAADESWTPLRRDLAAPVADCGVRVAVVGPDLAPMRTAVQHASFDRSKFTEERWHTMAGGAAYTAARCLLAYDPEGAPVAAATVWSAGTGRPGLLEPVGVHRDHRGHGYGTAITMAAASALREMGASSAIVCTPASNVGAVATYVTAGFQRDSDVTDFRKGG